MAGTTMDDARIMAEEVLAFHDEGMRALGTLAAIAFVVILPEPRPKWVLVNVTLP